MATVINWPRYKARLKVWVNRTYHELPIPTTWPSHREALESVEGLVEAFKLEGSKVEVEVETVYPSFTANVGKVYEELKRLADDEVAVDTGLAESIQALADDLYSARHILREENTPGDGHCEHGVYVGGCGADYMCGACEDGAW